MPVRTEYKRNCIFATLDRMTREDWDFSDKKTKLTLNSFEGASSEQSRKRRVSLNKHRELLDQVEEDILQGIKMDENLNRLLELRESIIKDAGKDDNKILEKNIARSNLERDIGLYGSELAVQRGKWERLTKSIEEYDRMDVNDFLFYTKRSGRVVRLYMTQKTLNKILEAGEYKGKPLPKYSPWSRSSTSGEKLRARAEYEAKFPLKTHGFHFAGMVATDKKLAEKDYVPYNQGEYFYKGDEKNIRVVLRRDATAEMVVANG